MQFQSWVTKILIDTVLHIDKRENVTNQHRNLTDDKMGLSEDNWPHSSGKSYPNI